MPLSLNISPDAFDQIKTGKKKSLLVVNTTSVRIGDEIKLNGDNLYITIGVLSYKTPTEISELIWDSLGYESPKAFEKAWGDKFGANSQRVSAILIAKKELMPPNQAIEGL